jgi:hypothetical protein
VRGQHGRFAAKIERFPPAKEWAEAAVASFFCFGVLRSLRVLLSIPVPDFMSSRFTNFRRKIRVVGSSSNQIKANQTNFEP